MAKNFEFEVSRGGGQKYVLRNDGTRAIASSSSGTLFFDYKKFGPEDIKTKDGVLTIGAGQHNKFVYDDTQSVRDEIEIFRSNFVGDQHMGQLRTTGSAWLSTQTSSGSSSRAHSGSAQSSAKARAERGKGVSIAETVSAMTMLFMGLAIILSLVVAFQKDQYGEFSATNVGIAIGFSIAAIFQGLLVLMIAQYIIAKLTD